MSEVPCRFDYYSGYGYCCIISKQMIIDGPVKINGVHMGGMSNDSVTVLNIRDCDMPAFPRNLHVLFPQLKWLNVENCTLKGIGREHIGMWKDLRKICIQGCKLKYLRGDTFRGLTELQSVSFPNNQLEEIEPDILDGLEKLWYVNFEENSSINAHAYGSGLSEIKQEIKLKCKPKLTAITDPDGQKVLEAEHQIQRKMAAVKFSQQNHQTFQGNKPIQHSKGGMKFKEFQHLLADEAFKDFTISIGESSFKVHKLIFAAHSQTLAELFRSNPEAQELNLLDIPEPTFKAVYDFIYTDQLPADVNFLEVFAAADRLKIDDLKEAAAAHLIESIDESNSFEILVLSNKLNHKELRMKAFENICSEMFPGRKLNDELAKQPEKLRNAIELKRKLQKELESMEMVD